MFDRLFRKICSSCFIVFFFRLIPPHHPTKTFLTYKTLQRRPMLTNATTYLSIRKFIRPPPTAVAPEHETPKQRSSRINDQVSYFSHELPIQTPFIVPWNAVMQQPLRRISFIVFFACATVA
jgi:hypothetical protein